MNLAKELIKTCYEMYRHNPTGLSAEITHFNDGRESSQKSNAIPEGQDLYIKVMFESFRVLYFKY